MASVQPDSRHVTAGGVPGGTRPDGTPGGGRGPFTVGLSYGADPGGGVRTVVIDCGDDAVAQAFALAIFVAHLGTAISRGAATTGAEVTGVRGVATGHVAGVR